MRAALSFTAKTLILSAILSATASAENWPNWRGPNQNGTADGSFPTTWSADENVAWKYDLPGLGASTPAVWEDKIFLTFVDNEKNAALCVNRSGEKVWQVELGDASGPKHKKASGANSSPVTDGSHVVFYFKSGALVATDMDGNIQWQKNTYEMFGENSMWWDQGTSPVIAGDKLIVTHQQTGPSWIAAFNLNDGELAWKYDRKLPAPEEAAQSYSTPIVAGEGAGQYLILAGADHVTAHSLKDGSEIWRVGDLNPTQHKFFRSISSPVANDTHVFVPYARGATLTAVRLGGKGDVTDTHVEWTKEVSADVPTPAFSGNRLYVLTDKKGLACLDAKTGETLWRDPNKHRKAFSASPIVADGKVYLTREDGTTIVVKDGDEYEELEQNELDEMMVSTPVLVDGKILLRTSKALYCITKQ